MKTWTTTLEIPAHTRGYGTKQRTTPARTVDVELTIYLDDVLKQLGMKAARNTNRKAVEMGGLITARIRNEKPTP